MPLKLSIVNSTNRSSSGEKILRFSSHPLLSLVCLLISILSFYLFRNDISVSRSIKKYHSDNSYEHQSILISYAYAERDALERRNMEYFLKAGTLPPQSGQLMEWVFVSSTPICEPCTPIIRQGTSKGSILGIGVLRLYTLGPLSLIIRTVSNESDAGSHNIAIQYLSRQHRLKLFRYFIFINSSAQGPFTPPYMPDWWHWTYAFLSRLGGPNKNHAVSSSLVCLPNLNPEGPGPRMEPWLVALDQEGLNLALAAGVFRTEECKFCFKDGGRGNATKSEYGLSKALLDSSANFTTLMTRYDPRTVWSNRDHWNCNNNVHPSRHGTYGGISLHPYETVFAMNSWHVGDVYTSRYGKWVLQHLEGDHGTQGFYNEALYRYSATNDAKKNNPLSKYYQEVTEAAHSHP